VSRSEDDRATSTKSVDRSFARVATSASARCKTRFAWRGGDEEDVVCKVGYLPRG